MRSLISGLLRVECLEAMEKTICSVNAETFRLLKNGFSYDIGTIYLWTKPSTTSKLRSYKFRQNGKGKLRRSQLKIGFQAESEITDRKNYLALFH